MKANPLSIYFESKLVRPLTSIPTAISDEAPILNSSSCKQSFQVEIRNIARLSLTVLAQTGRHQLTAKRDKRRQRSRQCGEEALASPLSRQPRSKETPVLNNGREVVDWIGLQFLQGLRLLTGCTGLAGTPLNQVSVIYICSCMLLE